uniref:B box-type domain-containing protein n=1 Tax=Romanomermis culicivorax TaxID=13658 RepID=A0A915JG13_ROMCU
MIKHQCGRCGEHFLQSGDLRILNCRLHVLCDACTHFQSGQNCSICNMKNNSETQKVQQQHLFQNNYNTDENHPNADDSTIFYQKNFAPIDNTINYLRPTSSMTGVGPFWPSLANRENSRPQFSANQNDATSAVGQKFFSNNNAPFFSTNDDNIVSLLTNNSSSSTATSFGFLAENKSNPILSKNYLNQHLKQAALYPANGDRNENLIVKTGVENDLSSNNLPETRFFNNLGSLIGLPHEKIQNCPGIFLLPQQQSQNSINGINCKNVSSPPGMTGGVFTGLTSLGDISVNTLNTTGIEGASSKFQDSSTLNLASPNSGVRRCSTCGIMLTVQSLNGYHHSSIGNNQSINGVKDLRSTAVFCSNCGKVSPTIATSTYDDKTPPLNDFTANLQVLNHNMANNCTLKNANNQNHQQNFNILNTSPANLSPSCNLATGNSTVSLVDVVTKGEASSFLQSALTSTQNGVCSLHAAASLEIATAFCETCLRFVCGLCNRIPQENNAPRSLSPHSNHKIAYGRSAALSRCRDFLRSPLIAAEFDRFFVRLDDEMRNVEQKSRDVRRDISARVRELITTLQQREQCLLQNEQTIKCEKLRALSEQRETAARLLSELNSATINPELVAAIETPNLSPTGISSPSSEIDVDKWCQIFGQFLRLLKTTLTEPLAEDDRLWFVPGCTAPLHHLNIHHGSANHAGGHQNNQLDSNSLVKLLRSFGCVVTGAFAGQSKLVGEYVRRAVKCKPVVYNCCSRVISLYAQVQTRGYFGEACLFGNDKVNIVVRTPQGAFVEGQVIDRKNGTYQCSVTPDVEGNHMVSRLFKLKGQVLCSLVAQELSHHGQFRGMCGDHEY